MKIRTENLCFVLIVGVFVTMVQAQPSNFVTVEGNQMIGPDNQPLLLRGINLGNWLVPEGYMFKFTNATSPRLIQTAFAELLGPEKAKKFWERYRMNYITRDDIAFIKSIGLNSIRVPFNYRLFVSEGQHPRLEGPGMDMLGNVVRWATEERLYVVFDMHCAPGGQTGDNIDDSYGYPFLFESEESQQLTIDIWKEIARRFSQEPAVIGYDLLNEPIATYFDAAKFNPRLEPLYKRIVSAIRDVDTNHICFIGGAQWNNNFSAFGPPFDKKLVYTYHKYWCDTTQAMVQEYADFSKKYNVSIWMGESGENTDQWIDAWRRLNEKNNFGWCFWPYKKMDATSCVASITRTQAFDSVIAYVNKPRTSFKEIRASRPRQESIDLAFEEYLENCRFGNCTINERYLRALGCVNPQNKFQKPAK